CRLDGAGVYVAISSEAEYINNSSKTLRWLEVHWYDVLESQEGDWVGLWDQDPVGALEMPLVQAPASGHEGRIRTNETWDGTMVPTNIDG
ncbi:hypothetical protein Pmani_035472, partial [Petrolisthes manimaculis]